MASYAFPPPYYGPGIAPTTPLCSYWHAQYPSPRYTSDGHYLTNTRIRPSSARGTSETYPSASARSFSFANPPPRYHDPAAPAFRHADLPGVFSHEFIWTDKNVFENVFIHIVTGSRVHRDGNANERERFGRREETNQYARHGMNYDDDGNPFLFTAAPRFDEPETWAREASTSTPRRPTATSTKKAPPVVPKATEGDARACGIPAGYSLKNWDPTETPILLLGSVFDANSLGKWIYDWTVFHHGPGAPISDVAAELWLLLIKLAGKMKRSEECMSRVRRKKDREMIGSFVRAGEELMFRLMQLLKACEGPMLKAGRKKGGKGVLKDNAGVEFVETLFGRERQLEGTEKFMASCRLWNMRFDANGEEIIRNPTF